MADYHRGAAIINISAITRPPVENEEAGSSGSMYFSYPSLNSQNRVGRSTAALFGYEVLMAVLSNPLIQTMG